MDLSTDGSDSKITADSEIEMSSVLSSNEDDVSIHSIVNSEGCDYFVDVQNFAEKFIDNIIEEAQEKTHPVTHKTIHELLAKAEQQKSNRLYTVVDSSKTATIWPTIGNFTVQYGAKKINEYLSSFSMTEEWMLVIYHLGETKSFCADFYHYEAVWSLPTPRYPIAQATATIFFTIEVSRVLPPNCTVKNHFTSCVVCTQCYYFLKNVENFKTKCTEVQKQLVTFNFGQVQSTYYEGDQTSYSKKRVYRRKQQVNTYTFETPLEEKKPRKTYNRKKKINVLNTDEEIPVPKHLRQIRKENLSHKKSTESETNNTGLENQVYYYNEPHVTVTTESTISNHYNNYATLESSDTTPSNNYVTLDPNVPIREMNWTNTPSIHQSSSRESVIQHNNSILKCHSKSAQLIDKLFDVISPAYNTTPEDEIVIDLAEFISCKENNEVPIIESENIQELQELRVNEVYTTTNSAQEDNTEQEQEPDHLSNLTEIDNVKATIENVVCTEASDIIEIQSDSDIEMNNCSQESGEEDDIFEEKITIVKNEVEDEENPSFFNRQTENGSYDCKLCSKKYKTSKGLYEHTQMKHAELKFYHCEICNFFTLWKSALLRHTDLFHSKGEVDTLEFLFCYHCSFRTASKYVLEKHLTNIHFCDNSATVIQ